MSAIVHQSIIQSILKKFLKSFFAFLKKLSGREETKIKMLLTLTDFNSNIYFYNQYLLIIIIYNLFDNYYYQS
jgi:hypothetical protein